MLKQRVITALIGLIIAIVCITFGGLLFDILILALTILGWREYTNMLEAVGKPVGRVWGYVSAVLIMGLISWQHFVLAAVVAALCIIGMAMAYLLYSKYYTLDRIAHTIFGMLYIIGGFSGLLLLRDESFYHIIGTSFTNNHIGEIFLWMLLLCTWASDTVAYFTGVRWGRHKIVPSISPNKSLEGFIGGFFGTILTGIIYGFILGLPFLMSLTISLSIAIFAPLGDLFESKLKRNCNIKDSGLLLPGHGGVLDRFDSLIFAAPIIIMILLVY